MPDENAIYEQARRHIGKIYESRNARDLKNFNRGWRYTDRAADRPVDLHCNDSAWTDVTLPHDYSIEHGFSPDNPSGSSGGYVKTGIVWYRKYFLGEEYVGKKTFLYFDGISANAELWINGVLVTEHPYGYTPLYADITPYLEAENIVAVKADTSLQPYSRYYQGTGIFRNVDIISTAPLHIEQFGVTYIFDGNNSVQVRTKVHVAGYPNTVWHDFGTEPNMAAESSCELQTTIEDANGHIIGSAANCCVIPEFSSYTFVQDITLDSPILWTADAPHMYYIRSEVFCDGALTDDEITPVGLRTIAYSALDGFCINGNAVKLKGVCLHQDCGVYGAAVPVRAWVKKLCILKEMGVNAIRTSHHPFPREFYDLCDLMGFYVLDEAFDEWEKGWQRGFSEMHWGKARYGYHQYFRQWSETDVRLMVKRDRVHPSVIMWSMGNEIPDLYYDEGVTELRRLAAVCREEDVTRPVTVCAEGQYRLPIAEGIMDSESVDIASYNYINIKNADYFDSIHRAYPDRVFLSSETFLEPQQWRYIEERSYVIGQFLWAGYDYIGECYDCKINDILSLMEQNDTNAEEEIDRGFGGLTSETRNGEKFLHGWIRGLIDIADRPKGHYYCYQSMWQTDPVIHIGVKMYDCDGMGMWWELIPSAELWDFSAGAVKTVYCFTNCDEIKLHLNGALVAERRCENRLPIEIPIVYCAGKLTATGYIGGVQVCSYSLHTAKTAKKLVANCDDFSFYADGGDVCQVEICVVDEEGHPVFAKTRIHFLLEGNGYIFRVGNGSNAGIGSYSGDSAETHNGRAIVVVKSNTPNETLCLTARAEGLEDVTVQLKSK